MNAEPTGLLTCLQALHLTAIGCWMAGQLWMWRAEVAVSRLRARPGRRAVSAATTLAATLALFSGAGLLAL